MTRIFNEYLGDAAEIVAEEATEYFVCSDGDRATPEFLMPEHQLPAGKKHEDFFPPGVSHLHAIILRARGIERARTAAEAWARRREPILKEWIAKYPGTRPSFWWYFEAPEELPKGESSAAFLARHNLLTKTERKALPPVALTPKPTLKVISND